MLQQLPSPFHQNALGHQERKSVVKIHSIAGYGYSEFIETMMDYIGDLLDYIEAPDIEQFIKDLERMYGQG